MIFISLYPRDLKPSDSAWSSEEQDALENYNRWFSWGDAHEYGENIKRALDALLILFPEHPALLLRRVEMLVMGLVANHKDVELLRALNGVLSSQSFLTDLAPEMLDEQIRMRALRSDVCIKQKAFDLALPDLAYLIEHTYEDRVYSRYYASVNARSKIFKAQGNREEELLDLNALLTPPFFHSQKHLHNAPYGNVHAYSQRGLYRRSEIFVAQKNYDDALRDLNALLYQEPWDAPALMLRSQVYQTINQQEQALDDELALHDVMLSSPVYQKPGEVQPVMLVPEELEEFDVEHGQVERVIPSLKAFAKMTFFNQERNIDTSAWVASNPIGVRGLLSDTGITPYAIHSMRTSQSHAGAVVGATIFEELETCELAAQDWDVGVSSSNNKKRKYDTISPSMS